MDIIKKKDHCQSVIEIKRIFCYIIYIMNFSSLVDSGVGSELERFILNHATLKPGDKLEGKVIEVKPSGRLLIHFGSFRALADAQFPIRNLN